MAVSVDSGRTSDSERQTIRSVQAELNRLGCNTGAPDGVIGPNSREALRQFAGARNIQFQVSDFRSQLFLRRIEKISGTVCQ
jgi:peptidoglycan hydrolase-like protein with peptidoglycan-binding domain